MDFSGIIIAGMAASLFILFNKWRDQQNENKERYVEHQKQNEEMEEVVNVKTENVVGTRVLFLDVLTRIGCQYELGEKEDDRIYFAYQGENFMVDTHNDTPYVVIWDAYWESVELYDIEEMSRMKKAINYANFNTLASTIYTINEDGKTMDVHSRNMFAFYLQIPDIENFLRAQLNDFFKAHQYIGNEVLRLRTEEKKM